MALSKAQQSFVNEVYQAGLDAGLSDAQARLAASQAALESAYGKRVKGNNFYGIKAGKSWKGDTQNLKTHEIVNGKRKSITDKFRKYDSFGDSLKDWQSLIERRWPDAVQAKTFKDAASALNAGKRGGYATDPNYASKLGYINGFIDEPALNISASNLPRSKQLLELPQSKPETMLASAGTPLMSAVEQMNAYAPSQSADSGVNAIEGLLGINPASPLSGAPRTPVTRSNLPDLPTQPKRDYPQLASRLGGISGDVLTQSKNPGMGGSNLATSPQVPTNAMGGSSAFLSGDLPQLPSSTVSQVGAANIPLTPLPSLPQAKAAPQFTPDYSNLEEIGGEKKKEEKESLADRVFGKSASKAAKIGFLGGAVLGVNPLAGAALGLGVNYLRNGNLSMPSLPSLNGIGDSVSNMFGKGSYIGPSGMDYAANTAQARGIQAMIDSGKKGSFWDYNTDQGHDGIVNQVIQDREAAAMSGKKTKSFSEKLSEDIDSWF